MLMRFSTYLVFILSFINRDREVSRGGRGREEAIALEEAVAK